MRLPAATFADSEGFLERECPDCFFGYRIKASDWNEKMFEYEVFCPKYSTAHPSDFWWMEEQIYLIKGFLSDRDRLENQVMLMSRGIGGEYETAEGFVRVSYRKGIEDSFVNNPPGIMKEWENTVKCLPCGTVFKTVGLAFTCPCCSFDNTSHYFRSFLVRSLEMLADTDIIKNYIFTTEGIDEADAFEEKLMCQASEDMI